MGGKNKLDKLIVVDLEATCWMPREEQGDQRSDIIEIGACKLDLQTGKISQKTSYMVRPANSTISSFCTELTTITQEDVNHGIPFVDACNKFIKEFGTKNRVWASWGDYDRKHFQRDCDFYKAKYPFGPRHVNAKTLFSLVNGLPKELGLRKAMEYYDLEFKGTQHRGHDDAFNIAKVLWKTLRKNYTP
jgi:inhibitor of KinA sporulation pathway (predicted exonuclease)